MLQKTAQDLLDHCQDVAGENLRVVTRYSTDEHEPIYTREDLYENTDITDETRGRFRYLLMQIHNAMWEHSRHHPQLEEPEVLKHSYGDIVYLQFPISEEEGIIVTFNGGFYPSREFISECKEIAYGCQT